MSTRGVAACIPVASNPTQSGKGILELQRVGGRQLIRYALDAVAKCTNISEIFVITDSREVRDVCEEYRVKVVVKPMPPGHDEAARFESIAEYLMNDVGFHGDVIVLSPLYPLRSAAQVDSAVEAYCTSDAPLLISQSPEGRVNGAIYIFAVDGFCQAGGMTGSLLSSSFVFMMDQRSSITITASEQVELLQEWLSKEPEGYSTDKQLVLAREYMDNLGQHLGGTNFTDPVLQRSARDVPERIATLLNIPHGTICLDVGCSCGAITIRLAQRGQQAIGIDIAPELIADAEEARSKCVREVQSRLQFVCSAVEDMSFDQGYFDTIYATEFFEHLPFTEHDRIMDKFIEWLKPGGNMIVSAPNRYPAQHYVKDNRHRWDWPNHLTHFTKLSLEYFLKRHFNRADFYPVYEGEQPQDGVFLVCNAYLRQDEHG